MYWNTAPIVWIEVRRCAGVAVGDSCIPIFHNEKSMDNAYIFKLTCYSTDSF